MLDDRLHVDDATGQLEAYPLGWPRRATGLAIGRALRGKSDVG